MTDFNQVFSRRRFLSGMAVLGLTPFTSNLAAFQGPASAQAWTGDDFEEAHELQRNPYALIRNTKNWVDHPEGGRRHDVVIVGGGISGLTIAYQLRNYDVALIERERQTGGVSKSENWNGIEYAIGAAYMIDPTPVEEDPDPRNVQNYGLLQELGLWGQGRIAEGDQIHCVFTNESTIPHEQVYNEENVEFFLRVLDHENYPAVPAEDPELIRKLDTVSFKQFLMNPALQQDVYGKTVGALSSYAWEAMEYYFWGAFGTNTWETSAYHGLNFFSAEFGNILVFPGGNAFIAKRLTDRLRQERPSILNTGYYVLQITPDEDSQGWTVLAYQNDTIHRFRTRAVIFSAPIFLARFLVPSLPKDQRLALESLDYRSYVVANVLLRRRMNQVFEEPCFRDGYELTRLHNIDPSHWLPDEISNRKAYSDVVVADFVKRAPEYAVLTVYRPYPYAHGRDRLRYLTYDFVESEIRREVLAGFSQHGLRESDIEGVRLTRWGHPMLIARPNQMADGTLATARRSMPGFYFSHTDMHGAPAIENALAGAFDTVDEVKAFLG